MSLSDLTRKLRGSDPSTPSSAHTHEGGCGGGHGHDHHHAPDEGEDAQREEHTDTAGGCGGSR